LPAPARTHYRPNNIQLLNDGTIVTSYSFRTINDNEEFTETSGRKDEQPLLSWSSLVFCSDNGFVL
jgi:hypothetical protein